MDDRMFWYWINERHRIWTVRQTRREPPWTDDPILAHWKFTNVFRRLDRVSVAYADRMKTAGNLAWETFLFRTFNWPPTFDLLREHGLDKKWSQKKAARLLTRHKDQGNKVFTGAYIITNSGSDVPKVDLACQSLTGIWKDRADLEQFLLGCTTLEEAWKGLLGCAPMVGPFVAYELVSDFRWSYLSNATDINTWAHAGPGAVRGLNRIFRGGPKNGALTNKTAEMHQLLMKAPENRADWVPELEMRDVEHSLCEYDKYMRVYNEEGQPRSKYRPSDPELFGVKT